MSYYPCTYKYYNDHSVIENNVRIWTCSYCGKKDKWSDEWSYVGNTEYYEAIHIDEVRCPDCLWKKVADQAEGVIKGDANMKLKEKMAEEFSAKEISCDESIRVNDLGRRLFISGFDHALQLAAKLAFEMGSVGISSKISKLGEIEIGEDKIT